MPQTVSIPKDQFPNDMDLKSCALYIDRSEMYTRNLVSKGDLPGTKVEGQWTFKKAELDKWLAEPRARGGGGPRGDGKMWKVRIPHAKLQAVRDDLKKHGCELEPAYKTQAKKKVSKPVTTIGGPAAPVAK